MKLKKWTRKELLLLIKLRKRGLTYREISKKIKRTISALQSMAGNIKCGIINIEDRK